MSAPFDPQRLFSFAVPDIAQTYGPRDVILYALSLGAGADPLDEGELRQVYEDRLVALPTLAAVLAYPGFWLKDPATGVDWMRVLHGEQRLTIRRPLPVAASVTGRTRITGLIDKGEKTGAFLYSAREIRDAASGEVLAEVSQTTVLRGNGGFGSSLGEASPALAPVPERAPDRIVDEPIMKQAALLYRLNGDANPLHADPAIARAVGFDRPILHGLCTWGMAGRILLREACGGDTGLFRSFEARFSAPIYPGETLRTEIWLEDGRARFRCRAAERDIVVLANGTMTMGAPS